MVRNTLKYVANKDMKAFAKDLKTIYTAADEGAARKKRLGQHFIPQMPLNSLIPAIAD